MDAEEKIKIFFLKYGSEQLKVNVTFRYFYIEEYLFLFLSIYLEYYLSVKMSLQMKCGEAINMFFHKHGNKCFRLDFYCCVNSNGSLYGLQKVVGCLRNCHWISQAFQ